MDASSYLYCGLDILSLFTKLRLEMTERSEDECNFTIGGGREKMGPFTLDEIGDGL